MDNKDAFVLVILACGIVLSPIFQYALISIAELSGSKLSFFAAFVISSLSGHSDHGDNGLVLIVGAYIMPFVSFISGAIFYYLLSCITSKGHKMPG